MRRSQSHISTAVKRLYDLTEQLEQANMSGDQKRIDKLVYHLKHVIGAVSSETYLQSLLREK